MSTFLVCIWSVKNIQRKVFIWQTVVFTELIFKLIILKRKKSVDVAHHYIPKTQKNVCQEYILTEYLMNACIDEQVHLCINNSDTMNLDFELALSNTKLTVYSKLHTYRQAPPRMIPNGKGNCFQLNVTNLYPLRTEYCFIISTRNL